MSPRHPREEHRSEPLDERLRDNAALAEIELTSRLMIAASGTEARLTQDEVDHLLGVGSDDDSVN
ncbi:hypothetical protein [Aeromicrobium phragmitis]|uniref:hypothetical protein n=1 Tax=Aeromicrobium phragmitis TaxID=2478914 RepID=UPI000EF669B3|nr:hypothetical protein [Aeromicrobium phragmitis]